MQSLPHSPSAERNKGPIFDLLINHLPVSGQVLEIGSGTGQHVLHFAAACPDQNWQPSERTEELPGLQQRLALAALTNISPALELDVSRWPWPVEEAPLVISINTAHIMSWPAVCAMFAGVGQLLENGAEFLLYGPFMHRGRHNAESNAEFDRQLKARSPEMGLRDIRELELLAARSGMSLVSRHPMPANNQILVFRKD